MSLISMCKDKVTLIKQDGSVYENIKANVQPNIIFIFDDKLPLEEKDKIFRILPNGLVEKYEVIDRGYYSAFQGIKAHYQVKVRKDGSIKEEQYKSITNIYNVTGDQSKININSIDNSVNKISTNKELFEKLITSLDGIKDENTKIKAINLAKEMEKSIDTPSFKVKFQSFISIVANYMTIVSPFIPALCEFL